MGINWSEWNKLDPKDQSAVLAENTYTCDQVRAAEYTLEPLKCIFCGSLEVVYLQYVDGGSGYCQECGEWQ